MQQSYESFGFGYLNEHFQTDRVLSMWLTKTSVSKQQRVYKLVVLLFDINQLIKTH